MVPSKLIEWNYEVVKRLCKAGESESERHDFKLNLPDANNLSKLCCAFSNTNGGFVIIGVEDRGKREFNILGIEQDKELYGKFTAKIRSEPVINIDQPTMLIIPDSSRVLYVFEIPRSSRSPHLPTPADQRVFWKRNGSHCVQMTLEEVRHQMLNYEEKREKLTLLLIDFSNKLLSLHIQGSMLSGQYDGYLFSFDVIDRILAETFSLLKSYIYIFRRIERLRNVLITVNIKKHRMIEEQSNSYEDWYSRNSTDDYALFARKAVPEVTEIIKELEVLFDTKFDVQNPYKI